MLSLVLYLLVLVCIIFCSLTVFILCVSKIVQVSNGFSLLDPEVSTGLRVRKWLLLGLAVANGMRCIASTVEFIIFSIKIVNNDEPTSSISYYDGFQEPVPFTIFICRVFPTVLFLACYGTMALYVSELYYSVRELKFSTIRTFWVAINLLFLVAFVQYLVISSNPRLLNIIGLVAVIIYSLWIAGFAYTLHAYFFHHNESSLSGPSVGQRKVFARLEVMVFVGLTALLSYAIDNALDIGGAFINRSFFLQSSVDLLTIFYSEVLCAWFYVSLLSNNLVVVEAKLQTMLMTMLQQQQAPAQGQGQGQQQQSLGTGNTSNNKISNISSSSGYGRGGIGASSLLLSSANSGGIKTTLQQQQQKQYKNYQSISMEESLP